MMMVKGVASSNSVVVTMMAVNRNCKPWAFRRHIILTLTLSLLSVHVRGISSKSAPFVFTTAATRVSTGLENLGNTCYINAQLQCAYHIPLVQRLICQQRYQEQVRVPVNDEDDPVAEDACEAPPPKEESIALQALRLVFQDMEQAAEKTGVVASTRVLCHSLGIPVMEQQDTQEFWKLLLPAMDLHPLTDLYTGVYEDYIVALDGSGRERRREETYLDLSLDIPLDPTKASVEGSLAQQFGTPELLTVAQGNAWRPEKGADKVDAHKGCQLMQAGLPSILQLHLKRFHFDWTTETTTKINHPLTFPKELDLSNLVKEKETAEKIPDASLYDLQSIIVHMGEFNSGHYYAYVRPDIRKEDWYRFNDHVVTPVSFDEVVRDAVGGRNQSSNNSVRLSERKKGQNPVMRILRRILSGGPDDDEYGFGGRTSNAYVLQYVRRHDIPLLYDVSINDED